MDEIWKEFASNYEISNHGNVRSISKNKILTPYKKGIYLRIDTSNHSKKTPYYIHRLVAVPVNHYKLL